MDRVSTLVLAGGRGLDFGPLSEQRTKAAFPIGGHYRVIDFVLSNLSHSGIRQVGLVIQFLPAPLMAHIGSGRPWEFDVADRQILFMTPFVGVRETRWFHGSGDAIAKNINLVNKPGVRDVLILSGDHVYRMDYRKLVQHHRVIGADVTMACVEIPPEHQHPRFGNVVADEVGLVHSFVEKPDFPMSSCVSMGIYLFRREALLDLLEMTDSPNDGREFSLAADVLQANLSRLKAHVWMFDRQWHYLADLREYHEFHMRMVRGELDLFDSEWDVMTNLSDRRLVSRPPVFFSPRCRASASIISPGCRIEGRVESSVLSPGVRVAPGAFVRNSVIFHDVTIGPDCRVEHAIIDKDAVLGKGVRVGPADGDSPPESPPLTVIPKSYNLAAGTTVRPDTDLRPVVLV